MSSMQQLAQEIRPRRGSDGRFHFEVTPHWDIWTPNGGFLASLAYSAAAAESSVHRPASIHCQFLRPGQHGPCEVAVETLRAGSATHLLRAVLSQQGESVLVASVTMTRDGLPGFDIQQLRPPSVPSPQALSSLLDLVEDPENWPQYWRTVEMRPCVWPEPFAAGDAVWRGWLNPQPDADADDHTLTVARLLLASDIGPFNAATTGTAFPSPWIAPNLDLYVQFHTLEFRSDWILIDSTVPKATGGLTGGLTHLWSCDGTLLSTSSAQLLCRTSPFYARQKAWFDQHMAGGQA